MSDFSFKGITASSLGISVQSIPLISKPPMRYTKHNIIGRDGAVYREEGYDDYEKPISIGVKDLSKINNIISWLTGTGNLIISNESDKVYTASVFEQIDIEQFRVFGKAEVVFIVAPHKYAISNEPQTFSGSIVVNNDTDDTWLPALTITGDSGATIKMDGTKIFEITDIDEYITIDSLNCSTFKGETLLNRRKKGDYLIIPKGIHTITVTGANISGCSLVVNKRWL